MKIQIDIDSNIKECEVHICCSEITDEVLQLQKLLCELPSCKSQMCFYKNDKEYYLPIGTILFFETANLKVYAHTKNDVFEVPYKLYELEKCLPNYFVRNSKSSILNVNEIYSITKNITSASLVEFNDTHKQIYISRNYFKEVKKKLEERNYYR